MNKALSIALLFAAAALVAANGTVDVTLPNPHAAVNSVSESVSALHKSLSAAHNMDMSKCECKKKCDDKKQEFCKVTRELVNKCKPTETPKDFIECTTKCFTADNVIEVNVPTIDLNNKGRRLFESTPVTKNGEIVLQHPLGHLLGGAAGAGAAAGGAAGGKDGKGKEICREICKPGTRMVEGEECGDEESVKYDCEDKVIYSSCKNVCTCPNGVTIETKESPNLVALAAGAVGTGHGAKGALAGAALQAVNALP